MNNNDKSFLDLTELEISKAIDNLGEHQYRTDQLDDWIYQKHVRNWADMNNLPLKFINELDSLFKLHPLTEIGCSGKPSDPAQ